MGKVLHNYENRSKLGQKEHRELAGVKQGYKIADSNIPKFLQV